MSADLHERLVELAGADLGEPDLIAGWQRGRRLRRLQRLRRVGIAAGCTAALLAVTLWLTGAAGPSPSVTVHPAGTGEQFSDPVHGLSISIPDGWQRAQQPLVGTIDPQELLSVATGPTPANTAGPACDAQLPKTELDHLRPTDLYVLVTESHFLVTPTSTTLIDPRRYPARPHDFATAPFRTIPCTGPTWSYPNIRFQDFFFRDHGRVIGLYLASGKAVTTTRRAQAWHLLNSLRLTPHNPPPKVVSGTEQTIITTTVPSDIDGLFQPGQFVAAWPVVPGTTPFAFSVNLSSGFVAADIDSTPTLGGLLAQPPRACTFWEGTLAQGGQGLGIQTGTCIALTHVASGSRAASFVMPDFPKPNQNTWVWSHLPAQTAYVTFSAGPTQLWERPVASVAGFVLDVPTQYQGPNFRAAPNPTLRAYDLAGHLLEQISPPRFLGDPNVPLS